MSASASLAFFENLVDRLELAVIDNHRAQEAYDEFRRRMYLEGPVDCAVQEEQWDRFWQARGVLEVMKREVKRMYKHQSTPSEYRGNPSPYYGPGITISNMYNPPLGVVNIEINQMLKKLEDEVLYMLDLEEEHNLFLMGSSGSRSFDPEPANQLENILKAREQVNYTKNALKEMYRSTIHSGQNPAALAQDDVWGVASM